MTDLVLLITRSWFVYQAPVSQVDAHYETSNRFNFVNSFASRSFCANMWNRMCQVTLFQTNLVHL